MGLADRAHVFVVRMDRRAGQRDLVENRGIAWWSVERVKGRQDSARRRMNTDLSNPAQRESQPGR